MTTRRATMSIESVAMGTATGTEAHPGVPADVLHRTSGEVFCTRRRCYATVSVVGREGTTGAFRYVQWCSLRGIANGCPEDCIHQAAVALRDPTSRPDPLR